MPFLQNRCVAAFNKRPRALSSSAGAIGFFFENDLTMRFSKSERGKIIKSACSRCSKESRGGRHLHRA
jgi:hypothetical protein